MNAGAALSASLPRSPYDAHPLAARHIRLITILAAQGGANDPVSCVFSTVSLDSIPLPEFDALSYCWGDITIQRPMQLDGQSWTLAPSLNDALRRLRREPTKVPLWVDALCINQGNAKEKNTQIPLMEDIYSRARLVHIWLGESDAETDEMVHLARNELLPRLENARADESRQIDNVVHQPSANVGGDDAGRPEDQDRDDAALRSRFTALSAQLFIHPWWTRTWTLQEVVLARSPVFLIGNAHTIPFHEMQAFTRLLSFNGEKVGFSSAAHKQFISMQGEAASVLSWRRWIRSIQCVVRLGDDREEFASRGPHHFPNLLVGTAARDVSDPRDRVYALLGMVLPKQRDNVVVDYGVGRMTVFHRTMCALWKSPWMYFNNLLFFPLDSQAAEAEGVPSWVPDFSKSWYVAAPLIQYATAQGGPWLGEKALLAASLSPDGRVLSMPATRISEVAFVQGIPLDPKNEPVAFVAGVQRVSAALVAAWSTPPPEGSEFTALERLRTRERPIQSIVVSENVSRTIGRGAPTPAAQLETLDINFAHEMASRTATDIARLWLANGSSIGVPEEETGLKFLLDLIAIYRPGAFFFTTRNGFMGFGPLAPAEGDVVFLPHGSTCPVLLRPVAQAQYKLVVPVCVSGLMDFMEVRGYYEKGVLKDEVCEVV